MRKHRDLVLGQGAVFWFLMTKHTDLVLGQVVAFWFLMKNHVRLNPWSVGSILIFNKEA